MRKTILNTIALVLCSSAAFGESYTLKFDVAPVGGYHWGTTKYTMESTDVASELDFPLDFFSAGFRWQVTAVNNGFVDWSVSHELVAAVSNPGGFFTDRDWFIDTDGTRQEFSNTKSNTDGMMWQTRDEITKMVYHGDTWDISVFAGFAWQKIKQDAIDVTGWQLVSDTAGNYFVVHFSFDTLALSYDIEYYRPLVGIVPRIYLKPSIILEARLAGSPLMYLKDLDNHRLRGFTLSSDGHGYSLESRVKFRFSPGQKAMYGRGLFLGLIGDFSYMRADLNSTILFYRDNEVEGFLAGDRIPGVPHKVTSSQFNVVAQVGWTF
jgi:hypothetical protein